MNKFQLNFTLLILLFSISFLFLSCDKGSFNKKSSKSEYDKKVEQELNSGIKNDDIFMTFRFGDSKNTVKNKFHKLRQEGKISLNDYREYEYKFVFNEYEMTNGYASFSQKFHNGKLYKFRMMVKPHDDMKEFGSSASYKMVQLKSESLFNNLSILYMDKYGSPISRKNTLNNKDDRFWIDGNRQIEISLADGFVNIFYTDLFVLKQMEEETRKNMTEQATSTKTDI